MGKIIQKMIFYCPVGYELVYINLAIIFQYAFFNYL